MTNASAAAPARGALDEVLLDKVPEVTAYFWIIKILATTVGETAADLLSMRLGLGLGVTSAVMAAVFVVGLAFQVRSAWYVPSLYWFTVVAISIVGTLVSDNLVDGYGVSLVTTSVAFAVILTVVFALWYRSERTLSIHSIVTRRRELYYWAAILFTFALGTSVGDLLAEQLDLGYATAAVVFAGMIAAVAAAHYLGGLNAILAFWTAYVLTRPLGASVGDLMAKPAIAGGFGLGTVNTSLIFLAVILALVVFLTVSRVDRLDAAR
ncbi:COG4705 family protein [Lichenibacterium dinghuense]|uniref:COG4705 family protein n=1 Tax=Lichenibacterium dinghuense TaxID=2895977 RepID=UPI001F3A22A1|nr:hypothetical protein [Lichenibacterium sp. 6Y81]